MTIMKLLGMRGGGWTPAMRLDFHVYGASALSLAVLALAILGSFLIPERYGVENSFIENIQAALCILAAAVAATSRREKELFNFAAMLSIVLFLREINCGRVLFPIEGRPNAFKTYAEIGGMWRFVPAAYALFMAFAIAYFAKHCAPRAVLYLKKARIPAWDSTCLAIGIACGTIGETLWKNEIFEECFETLFYVAFTSLVWLYSRNPKFTLEGQAAPSPNTPRPERRTGARA